MERRMLIVPRMMLDTTTLDAANLLSLMYAAFTGDANEARDVARKYGDDVGTWDNVRLQAAVTYLKNAGTIARTAPDVHACDPRCECMGRGHKRLQWIPVIR